MYYLKLYKIVIHIAMLKNLHSAKANFYKLKNSAKHL